MGDSWTCAGNIQDELGTCCITKGGSTQTTHNEGGRSKGLRIQLKELPVPKLELTFNKINNKASIYNHIYIYS